MTTFDQILPITTEVLAAHRDKIAHLEWLVINRDLNGRVRFIAPEHCEADAAQRTQIEGAYRVLAERLAPHAYRPKKVSCTKPPRRKLSTARSPSVWAASRMPGLLIGSRTKAPGNPLRRLQAVCPASCSFPSRVVWGVQRHWRPAPGHWQEQASASWSWIWTSNRQGCLPACCRLIGNPGTALPTGWWRIWSITGTCSLVICMQPAT